MNGHAIRVRRQTIRVRRQTDHRAPRERRTGETNADWWDDHAPAADTHRRRLYAQTAVRRREFGGIHE